MEGLTGYASIPGNGALDQQQRPRSIYEEHAEAVKEWHEACHNFAHAANRRDQARRCLDEVNAKLGQTIQMVDQDPTTPQAAPVPTKAYR